MNSAVKFPQNEDGNFADLVFYYAEGLVQRNLRMTGVSQVREKDTPGNERIILQLCVGHDLDAEKYHDKDIYRQWVESRDARGILGYAGLKKGKDRDAFLLATYMVAQHELLSFHPTVRSNTTHQHNVQPYLKMSREDSSFSIRMQGVIAGFNAKSKTTGDRSLHAARLREIMLSANHEIEYNTSCFYSSCTGQKWSCSMPSQSLTSARDAFFKDLRHSSRVAEAMLALCMGTHNRLGEDSALHFLSGWRELLEMIMEHLFHEHLGQLTRLLAG